MTERKRPPIGGIAPWFGSKRTMAAKIVAELGPHTQYFEPFCGSLAVLFAKKPSQKETVCDLHKDLINLTRVVQRRADAEALYDRLGQTLLSEDLLARARVMLAEPVPEEFGQWEEDAGWALDRAYWYFVECWMGRSGTAGTARVGYQIAVRWTKGGGSPTVRWRNTIESIPWWHKRLQNPVILCRDAFRILHRFEDIEGTAIYVDSPYHPESRGSRKHDQGSRYLHEFRHSGDMFDGPDDHTRLRDILAQYQRARIVISQYDGPNIRVLYDGWTIMEHTKVKNLTAHRGGGTKDAPEILIMNGPSFATDP